MRERPMMMSKRSLETLIDLVEIKLSCLEVYDRDDARELANLQHCLDELLALAGGDVPPEVRARPAPKGPAGTRP